MGWLETPMLEVKENKKVETKKREKRKKRDNTEEQRTSCQQSVLFTCLKFVI